ncbi:uncharacterized protein LOC141665888 [Apium graveolens]|uniref:uncharacterized protein LOC141665888 n=1 Tax=Apium graveolens TaxID=4045 RepID=UPI003D79E653
MSKSADINPDDNDFENKHREYVSMKEYYCYKLMIRLSEGLALHLSGYLWQQYAIDAFCEIEQYRFDWVTTHQITIRSDLYTFIRDALRKGDHDPNYVGKAVILPVSFTGSQSLETLYSEHLILTHYTVMHVIEFQKRGLPHMHMLIWLHPDSRPKIVAQIDALVSAEIPDKDTDHVGYAAVSNYMIHGPYGVDNTYSPCMVKGRCMRHFPKRFNGNTYIDDCGFPIYRRRNTGRSIKNKGVFLDNRFVVPFNRDILVLFQCHINLEQYLDGRYVCASEAAWRIFGFDVHSRWPYVDRLPIHLPGNKYVNFRTGTTLSEVVQQADSKRTKLEAWFEANKEFPAARDFTYAEFPMHFTWLPRDCKWKPRQRGDVVGRLTEVHATGGDLLYLRMLLMRRKEIEKLLNDIGNSLKDFPTMPYPPEVFLYNSGNGLIAEETGYDREQMKRQHDENYIKLNREQKEVYEAVVESMNSNKGEQFFVYGSGGCGKTFVWQTLLCRLRSERKIVFPVASSGIAVVLLDGGRTAHSRFHIPIIVDQCSVAGIKHDINLAELLQNTSLIIWDEAPMQHRHGIESVDKCLRDIMAHIDPSRSSRPFGGITVVFGGDYRQTLLVIPKASRGETIGSTLNRSKL